MRIPIKPAESVISMTDVFGKKLRLNVGGDSFDVFVAKASDIVTHRASLVSGLLAEHPSLSEAQVNAKIDYILENNALQLSRRGRRNLLGMNIPAKSVLLTRDERAQRWLEWGAEFIRGAWTEDNIGNHHDGSTVYNGFDANPVTKYSAGGTLVGDKHIIHNTSVACGMDISIGGVGMPVGYAGTSAFDADRTAIGYGGTNMLVLDGVDTNHLPMAFMAEYGSTTRFIASYSSTWYTGSQASRILRSMVDFPDDLNYWVYTQWSKTDGSSSCMTIRNASDSGVNKMNVTQMTILLYIPKRYFGVSAPRTWTEGMVTVEEVPIDDSISNGTFSSTKSSLRGTSYQGSPYYNHTGDAAKLHFEGSDAANAAAYRITARPWRWPLSAYLNGTVSATMLSLISALGGSSTPAATYEEIVSCDYASRIGDYVVLNPPAIASGWWVEFTAIGAVSETITVTCPRMSIGLTSELARVAPLLPPGASFDVPHGTLLLTLTDKLLKLPAAADFKILHQLAYSDERSSSWQDEEDDHSKFKIQGDETVDDVITRMKAGGRWFAVFVPDAAPPVATLPSGVDSTWTLQIGSFADDGTDALASPTKLYRLVKAEVKHALSIEQAFRFTHLFGKGAVPSDTSPAFFQVPYAPTWSYFYNPYGEASNAFVAETQAKEYDPAGIVQGYSGRGMPLFVDPRIYKRFDDTAKVALLTSLPNAASLGEAITLHLRDVAAIAAVAEELTTPPAPQLDATRRSRRTTQFLVPSHYDTYEKLFSTYFVANS